MHPHLFPTITLSFVLITITLIQFPPSYDAQYLNCSAPFECAGTNFGYPFWGSNRPDYCGYPGFELNCSADFPQLKITDINFRVLEINDVSRTLKVARADYWKSICPATIVNTTINFTIFSYSSDTTNLTLFYECLPSVSLPNQPFFQFPCSKNSTAVSNYYSSSPTVSAINNLMGSCSYNVKVPVVQSAAELGTLTSETALIEAIDGGFTLGWSANNSMCDRCQNTGGQCGFDTSSTNFVCHCTNGTSPLTCGPRKQFWKRNLRLIIAIGIPGGVAGIVVISLVIICSVKRGHLSSNAMVCWKRDAKNDEINADEILNLYGSIALKRYTYSDVKKLTNSFKDKVGQGGYGVVYKGKLPDGRIVAVKVLSESKGNGEEFINEVASISGTSHVNIVTLLGFCYERTKRALIYEFVPSGSLDKFIYDQGSSIIKCHLDRKSMFQIAVGVARGLEYLHRGCRTKILHFDIKPHNILLDEDLCPKISDFGLAKLCKTRESIVSMTGMRGTAGYIAPEVFSRIFGRVSHKSDVYSYGMLVLEMVGGRKNFDDGVSHTSEMSFPHWIYNKLEKGEALDTSGDMTDDEEDMIKKMIIVSLWCIQTNPSDRPSMNNVIEMLECTFQSQQFPPKPFLNSPTRSAQNSSTTP